MNFAFDGRYKSKPSINLSGSSKNKNLDDLIKDASNERKKRETEKRQLAASITIQSAYRSYLVRKNNRAEFRKEFDALIEHKNQQVLDQCLTTLFKQFITFYHARYDSDRLMKISNLVIKNKETLVKSIYINDLSSLVLAKFLIIQIQWLIQSSKYPKNSQSTNLRIIDYFTDPDTHLNFNQNNRDIIVSRVLFNHLVKNNYIQKLTEFSLLKIPSSAHLVTSSPIAYSIAQLFYRCFLHLEASADENREIDAFNVNIVKSLFNELFSKADLPQIKCVIENLSTIVCENSNKAENLQKYNQFLKTFAKMTSQDSADHKKTFETLSPTKARPLSFQVESLKTELYKLYSLLKTYNRLLNKLTDDHFNDLLNNIRFFLIKIPILNINSNSYKVDEDDDEGQIMETDEMNMEKLVLNEILKMFDSNQFANKIETMLNHLNHQQELNQTNSQLLTTSCLSIAYIANFILFNSKLKTHQSLILRKLAFNKFFLFHLWQVTCSMQATAKLKQEIYILQMLASGSISEIYHDDLIKIVAPLSTFCCLYNLFLLSILDKEFLQGEAVFSKMDLIKMSSVLKDVCIGVISLMHPDPYANTASVDAAAAAFGRNLSGNLMHEKQNLLQARSVSSSSFNAHLTDLKIRARYFTHLFQTCAQLVQRMYTRDIRSGFCPEEHWISNSKFVALNKLSSILQAQDPAILTQIKFGRESYLFQNEIESDFKLSLNDIRSLTILQELPFTISFTERVVILESFSYKDHGFPHGAYKIRIRRDYLYEDAFDNLSLENAPDLKSTRIMVEMVNQLGLDEAGIDGGGLFREFIIQLLENGFDPNRGFFVLTSDGFLFPNPNVSFLVQNYTTHYFFLGRMLGKAIETKTLSQLKFAGFFLQKILSKYIDTRLDIDYLASLDPQVYKNLISLKDYKTDVRDLELNFAVNLNEFGETKLVELKPGGKDIPVTNDNKIEYIHLLSDYKLNKQIHEQVIAFRNGISNVINLDLLRLFNFNEFQNLISGGVEIIDVNDWKRHTAYSGNYDPENPVIVNFWRVVEDFDENLRKKLLKFATSRSRAPLFGFKNLIPSFAIQNSGSADRLPTASTCMNLLKLPPIEDYEALKEKLICAIESDSGFDLS